jgi:hypothetical protein
MNIEVIQEAAEDLSENRLSCFRGSLILTLNPSSAFDASMVPP